MEPADPQNPLHVDEDDDEDEAGVSVTSWLSVCPRGVWKVQQKQSHERRLQTPSNSGLDTSCSSGYCPQLGSLCRVRVRLKANVDEAQTSVTELDDKLSISDLTDATPTAFPRSQDSVLQVPLDEWTTLRLGEGQCDVVETCLETMRAGEKCEILLSAVGNESDVSKEPGENVSLRATVELQAFTPGKASWEMSPVEKWEWVKSHKETGGARFRSGDVWGAAHSYSQALKLLITLSAQVTGAEKHGHEHDGHTDEARHLPPPQGFKTIKAELHSNMSLCQLKLKQPERAKDSAAKATELEPGAAKAWYRLGQACQMVGELEEAKRAFRKLLALQPEFPAALKALKDIAVREKETNAQLGLRLSKMFT